MQTLPVVCVGATLSYASDRAPSSNLRFSSRRAEGQTCAKISTFSYPPLIWIMQLPPPRYRHVSCNYISRTLCFVEVRVCARRCASIENPSAKEAASGLHVGVPARRGRRRGRTGSQFDAGRRPGGTGDSGSRHHAAERNTAFRRRSAPRSRSQPTTNSGTNHGRALC